MQLLMEKSFFAEEEVFARLKLFSMNRKARKAVRYKGCDELLCSRKSSQADKPMLTQLRSIFINALHQQIDILLYQGQLQKNKS